MHRLGKSYFSILAEDHTSNEKEIAVQALDIDVMNIIMRKMLDSTSVETSLKQDVCRMDRAIRLYRLADMLSLDDIKDDARRFVEANSTFVSVDFDRMVFNDLKFPDRAVVFDDAPWLHDIMTKRIIQAGGNHKLSKVDDLIFLLGVNSVNVRCEAAAAIGDPKVAERFGQDLLAAGAIPILVSMLREAIDPAATMATTEARSSALVGSAARGIRGLQCVNAVKGGGTSIQVAEPNNHVLLDSGLVNAIVAVQRCAKTDPASLDPVAMGLVAELVQELRRAKPQCCDAL